MIYTVKNTSKRNRPMRIYLDGMVVTQSVYLDRRRRVIRRFATDDKGNLVIAAGKVPIEEVRYSHKQNVTVEWI